MSFLWIQVLKLSRAYWYSILLWSRFLLFFISINGPPKLSTSLPSFKCLILGIHSAYSHRSMNIVKKYARIVNNHFWIRFGKGCISTLSIFSLKCITKINLNWKRGSTNFNRVKKSFNRHKINFKRQKIKSKSYNRQL